MGRSFHCRESRAQKVDDVWSRGYVWVNGNPCSNIQILCGPILEHGSRYHSRCVFVRLQHVLCDWLAWVSVLSLKLEPKIVLLIYS